MDISCIDTFEGYKEDLKLYAALLMTQPKTGDVEERVEKRVENCEK